MFIWNGPGNLKGNGVRYKEGSEVPDGVIPDDLLESMKADGRISDGEKPSPTAPQAEPEPKASVQTATESEPEPDPKPTAKAKSKRKKANHGKRKKQT